MLLLRQMAIESHTFCPVRIVVVSSSWTLECMENENHGDSHTWGIPHVPQTVVITPLASSSQICDIGRVEF